MNVLRNLGTKEVAIENLEGNYRKVEEQCYQGLLAWSRSPPKATTKQLCNALRLAGCSEALETLSREGIGQIIACIATSTPIRIHLLN